MHYSETPGGAAPPAAIQGAGTTVTKRQPQSRHRPNIKPHTPRNHTPSEVQTPPTPNTPPSTATHPPPSLIYGPTHTVHARMHKPNSKHSEPLPPSSSSHHNQATITVILVVIFITALSNGVQHAPRVKGIGVLGIVRDPMDVVLVKYPQPLETRGVLTLSPLPFGHRSATTIIGHRPIIVVLCQ